MVKFWMVWGPRKELPTKRHNSVESAIEEAKRLAGLEKDSHFIVLEAMWVSEYCGVTTTPLIESQETEQTKQAYFNYKQMRAQRNAST